jgi:flagellar protein FlbD
LRSKQFKTGGTPPIQSLTGHGWLAILNPRTDSVLQLTRLGGPVFALNPDLIERAEATPDTVLTLVNGSRYVIRESIEELAALVRQYRAGIIVASQQVIEPAPPHRPSRPHPAPTKSRDVSRATVISLRGED